jgi:hypothetical protein
LRRVRAAEQGAAGHSGHDPALGIVGVIGPAYFDDGPGVLLGLEKAGDQQRFRDDVTTAAAIVARVLRAVGE